MTQLNNVLSLFCFDKCEMQLRLHLNMFEGNDALYPYYPNPVPNTLLLHISNALVSILFILKIADILVILI